MDRATRIRLHLTSPGVRSMLCAGLPTRGPPNFGLGRRPGDPRLVLLGQVLQFAWHSQASCLILEGSADLARLPQLQQMLKDFADRAEMQLHQIELDLADQWASSRVRWWAILLPAGLPTLQLHRWPVQSPPLAVQDIIPEWPVWPTMEEADLLWDPKEQQAFADPAFGPEPRILAASSHVHVDAEASLSVSRVSGLRG